MMRQSLLETGSFLFINENVEFVRVKRNFNPQSYLYELSPVAIVVIFVNLFHNASLSNFSNPYKT